jgi:hypothetical protein
MEFGTCGASLATFLSPTSWRDRCQDVPPAWELRMITQSGQRPRLARLRPAFAQLYPGIAPDVWLDASVMVDKVWLVRLRSGQAGVPLRHRVLDPEHFEFRHGASRGGVNPHPRGRLTDRGELLL